MPNKLLIIFEIYFLSMKNKFFFIKERDIILDIK